MNEADEIESSAGLHFSKLQAFHHFQLTDQDVVFIPGIEYLLLSDPQFLAASQPFFDWLVQQYERGALLCSVCTGAFLLAETGLLTDNYCTTHWKYFNRFQQKYPQIHCQKNRLFVKADRLYSSAGVSSGIDLALYIIEEKFGAKFATDIAKEVVIYFRRSESDPQLSVFLQYRNHLDTRIHEAQDWMLQQLSHSPTLEQIAEQVNMSSRNFTRLFKKTTHITVGAYLEKLRIELAVNLLSEGNKVNFVAQQCGLKSPNQLRSLLRKHKGILPTDLSILS